MAPSSAMENDPSSAYNPPITQTVRKTQTEGRYFAISPGVRRIPAPMVFPMMTASPKPTPRMRSREPREAVSSFGFRVSGLTDAGSWAEETGLLDVVGFIPFPNLQLLQAATR